MAILQLPELLAKEKGIRIIVCIDEFQQMVDRILLLSCSCWLGSGRKIFLCFV